MIYFVLFVVAQFDVPCSNPRVRKDFRYVQYYDNKWTRIISAYRQMKQTGRITQYAKMHSDMFSSIHQPSKFIAWHRAFLWEFENEIRAIGGEDLTLPYIDWGADAYSYSGQVDKGYANHPYFYAQQQQGQCLVGQIYDSFLKSSLLGGGSCVARDLDTRILVSSWADIDNIIFGNKNFATFNSLIQYGVHADVHMRFSGDMSTPWSVIDPLFFGHHGFIDLIANTWQYVNWAYSGSEVPNETFQINGRTYNYRTVMRMTGICVKYQRWMQTRSSQQLWRRQLEVLDESTLTSEPQSTETEEAHYDAPIAPEGSQSEVDDYNNHLKEHYDSVKSIIASPATNTTEECIKKIVDFYPGGFLSVNNVYDDNKLKALGLDPKISKEMQKKTQELRMQLNSHAKGKFTVKSPQQVIENQSINPDFKSKDSKETKEYESSSAVHMISLWVVLVVMQ